MTQPTSKEAVGRIRAFVESRKRHRQRMVDSDHHKFMTPDHITAEYGRLDIADLIEVCDGVEMWRGIAVTLWDHGGSNEFEFYLTGGQRAHLDAYLEDNP